jgi:hypothetical protein
MWHEYAKTGSHNVIPRRARRKKQLERPRRWWVYNIKIFFYFPSQIYKLLYSGVLSMCCGLTLVRRNHPVMILLYTLQLMLLGAVIPLLLSLL